MKLARWITKTVMMFDLAAGLSTFPESAYRRFRERRRPPPATFVWLACYGAGTYATLYEAQSLYTTQNPSSVVNDVPTEEDRPDAYCFTFNLSRALFQLVYFVEPVGVNLPDVPEFITRLWPATGQATSWPTSAPLSDRGFDLIAPQV